jgi:1-acyl-sn-glycerol-3-phosphate acyltransferase
LLILKKLINKKYSVIIFPEGRFVHDTAVGKLKKGVLNIAKETKSKSIVIQDKNGRRIEIPAEFPKEKIRECLEAIRQMEEPKIEIT